MQNQDQAQNLGPGPLAQAEDAPNLADLSVAAEWESYKAQTFKGANVDPVFIFEAKRAFYASWLITSVTLGRIGLIAESDEQAAATTDRLYNEAVAEIPKLAQMRARIVEKMRAKQMRKVGKRQ